MLNQRSSDIIYNVDNQMSIGKIPAFKPLAIIEQDELLQLK